MKPVFQFGTISVGGCGGQLMGAKSILMVVSQISASRHHLHTLFFTHLPIFVGNTTNWSRAYQYWTPCSWYSAWVQAWGLCIIAIAASSIPNRFTFFFNWEKRSYDPRAQKTVIWLQGWNYFPWSTKYQPCYSQRLFTIPSQYFTEMKNINLTHDVFYQISFLYLNWKRKWSDQELNPGP